MKLVVRLWMVPLLVTALWAVACSGGSSPTRPSTAPTSLANDAPAALGDCGSFTRPGLIAFNGTVVAVGEPRGGYPDYSHGHQIIDVRLEFTAIQGIPGDRGLYAPGKIVEVNLLDPFFPIVAPGACVAAAGTERTFWYPKFPYWGIAYEKVGFVADDFDVLTAD